MRKQKKIIINNFSLFLHLLRGVQVRKMSTDMTYTVLELVYNLLFKVVTYIEHRIYGFKAQQIRMKISISITFT